MTPLKPTAATPLSLALRVGCAVAVLAWTGWAAQAQAAPQSDLGDARAGRPGKTAVGAVRNLPATAPAAGSAAIAPVFKAPAQGGEAEARLIEIYKLVGDARSNDALVKAEALVRDHPNFQLAQLVYGDLLAARQRPLRTLGDVPEVAASAAPQLLASLREESQVRMRALLERPPPGAVPSQFLQLAPRYRHAIAVDTSRSRLYLFRNGPHGLKLLADYYITIGRAGVDKLAEGDARTPLGVYFITGSVDPKSLKDFYGAGALPINYPNRLDLRMGRTGGGIWLHGTPPDQFARAPRASDGCIVLANPDLLRIARTVEARTTPVVIAERLAWVAPERLEAEERRFASVLRRWSAAKASSNAALLRSFYTDDAVLHGKPTGTGAASQKALLKGSPRRPVEMKNLAVLRWNDTQESMVVTFDEVAGGRSTGPTKRQYWLRQGSQWKIFYEGVIS